MKSIGLFSSYFVEDSLPYYVEFYLENIRPFFTEICLITNKKDLNESSHQFLKNQNINLLLVENKGLDFGMWHHGLQHISVEGYERLALINDSCILFREPSPFFYWMQENTADFYGMIDSHAVQYHLQSYFLVFEKKAIPAVCEYFKQTGILHHTRDIIQTYEIGLTQFLVHKGFSPLAFYDQTKDAGEFSPAFAKVRELIQADVPLIKKKVLMLSFRPDERLNLVRMHFRMNPHTYIQLIQTKYQDSMVSLIDFSKVIPKKNWYAYYQIACHGISVYLHKIWVSLKSYK